MIHRDSASSQWSLLAVLGGLALLCVTPAASAAGLELEGRYWAASLDSTVDFNGVIFDDDLDLTSAIDLGLDAEDELEARLTLRPGWGFFLRGAYQNVAASNDGFLDLDFFGLELPFDVASRLDFEYGRVALGWQFVNPGETLRIGPFVEAKGVRGDVSVTATILGLTDRLSEDFEVAVASAGVLLDFRPTPRLQVFGELSVAVDTDEVDLTDAEAGLRYFVNDHFGVGGGYRVFEIQGEIDGVALDLELDGVFASLVLAF